MYYVWSQRSRRALLVIIQLWRSFFLGFRCSSRSWSVPWQGLDNGDTDKQCEAEIYWKPYQHCQGRSISQSTHPLNLVHSLVFSHLDFCNSFCVDLPNTKLRPLQRIINNSARLVTQMPIFSRSRITPVCIDLHFLPLKARIKYKICLLTYKALKFRQPSYLVELLQQRTLTRTLRSEASG